MKISKVKIIGIVKNHHKLLSLCYQAVLLWSMRRKHLMDHMILNNYLFINIYAKTVLFAPNYQLFYFNIAKIIFKSKGTYIAKNDDFIP
jgi:hypothetical protein